MTSAASTLLTVPLGRSAPDLTTSLGFMSSQPGIRHLANKRLMHQPSVDLNLKNFGC
jgi:hypothetical protein